jgi:hypothetical protein
MIALFLSLVAKEKKEMYSKKFYGFLLTTHGIFYSSFGLLFLKNMKQNLGLNYV